MHIGSEHRHFRIGLVIIPLLGVLHGCASSRLLKNPTPPIHPDVTLAASTADGITVTLHQLIVRDSGGSWVRKANWDEYVLEFKNDSDKPIAVQSLLLHSDKLAAPVETSNSRQQLDARTSGALRTLKDVGIVAGVGLVAPSAIILGTIGSTGSLLAGAAAAAVGVVVLPATLIGSTVYVVNRHRVDKHDRMQIDRILAQRAITLPVQILPQTALMKSAFFPITPAPSRLTVSYFIDDDVRDVELPLPGLSGLHLKTSPAPSGPVAPIGVGASSDSNPHADDHR